MRYLNIPTLTFVDDTGVARVIRDLRELPTYSISSVVNRGTQEDFDEIYSRPNIAGNGQEAQSFQLHEANIVEICDAGFEYDRLRSVKVPV